MVKTYIIKFWHNTPQGNGYHITEEYQAVSHEAAKKRAEAFIKGWFYGTLDLISVELKQEKYQEKQC